jgi:hypothetical protein
MKTNDKRRLYLLLWLLTGLLLGILVGGLLEYIWLYYDMDTDMVRLGIYSLTIVTGLIFGYIVGPKAWKMIYVNGARGKKYVIKH